MLRITLKNEFMGPLVTLRAIGINEIVQNIKRGEDSDGLFYSLILDLKFIKDERSYIRDGRESYGGLDCLIEVLIEQLNPNTYKFEKYYEGVIDYNKYELEEDRVGVNIREGSGFQTAVLNGMDTTVNLETLSSLNGTALPAMLVVGNLPLHAKTILRNTDRSAGVKAGVLASVQIGPHLGIGIAQQNYMLYSMEVPTLDEIEEYFDVPDQFTPNPDTETPTTQLKYRWFVKESGQYKISINSSTRIKCRLADNTAHNINMSLSWTLSYGKLGALTNVVFGAGANGSTADFKVNGTLVDQIMNLNAGDVIFINGALLTTTTSVQLSSVYLDLLQGDFPFSISMEALTVFPASTTKSVLLHEAIKKCIQVLTGQADCFKSDLLGRTDIGYAIDGEGSLIAITNGKLIRKLPAFSITRSGDLTTNLKYLLDFVNAVYCTAWGFEVIGGVTKFVLEKRSYWYDTSGESIDLGRVGPVMAVEDRTAYISKFTFGYSTKMEKNEINSIDEFNTLRTYNVPITNTKNTLDVSTEMKVSGYQIEQQRRLITSSEDSKLDDELFAICVVRDGGSFKSQKTEGFTAVTNLFDSATAYNLNISPRRVLNNWLPYLSTMLIRSFDKYLKFGTGGTNFLMTSMKTGEASALSENSTANCTNVVPLFDPTLYQIKDAVLTRDQVKLLQANPKKYVKFQDRFGFIMKGFVSKKGIEHNSNEGKAIVELIKLV